MRIAQSVKTDEEIELMRIAGRKLARVHEALREFIRPGITTKSVDELGERLILEEGGVPNFKNYGGYPASICVSVNDEIVHGIPSEERVLKEGDIVSLNGGESPEGGRYCISRCRTYMERLPFRCRKDLGSRENLTGSGKADRGHKGQLFRGDEVCPGWIPSV